MNTKKRLFEVFSKVNKIVINEDVFDNTDSIDGIKEEILWHFNQSPKIFNEGIPNELNFNIQGQDVILTLDEENPIDYEGTNENQISYSVHYNFIVQDVPYEVIVLIVVTVEKVHDGQMIKFYNQIMVIKEYIQVQQK